MNLGFLAEFFLILSLTSAIGLEDKNILVDDDDENEDLSTRKLLYVVGVYPEWEQKIADFKEEWGENGEKYLNQPDVYIHGDVSSSIENVTRRMTGKSTLSNVPIVSLKRRSNSKIDQQIAKSPNFVKKHKETQNNIINNEMPENVKMNTIDIKRRKANILNNINQRRDFDSILSNIIKPEIKDNIVQKKFNNFDHIMRRAPINFSNIEKEGTIGDDMKKKYNEIDEENTLKPLENSNKTETKNFENERKAKNISRMYARILMRKFLEAKKNNEKENNFGNNISNLTTNDINDDNKINENHVRKYNKYDLNENHFFKNKKINKRKRPKTQNYITIPQSELEWILSKLINEKEKIILEPDEYENYSSENLNNFESPFPIITFDDNSIRKKLDNVNIPNENKNIPNENSKLLENNGLMRKRILTRLQQMGKINNVDNNENVNSGT